MKINVFYILLLSVLLLSGCSGNKNLIPEDIKVSTLLIKENSEIQSAIVGDFDKPYYNEEAFEAFVKEEIEDYNQSQTKEVVDVSFFEIKEKQAKVVLNFLDMKNYALFNNVFAKYISTEEALKDKNIPDEFICMKTEKKVTKEEALKEKKYKVIMVKEPLDIKVEGKIKYYANSVLLNDKAVHSADEGISVVVIKP